MSKTGDGGLYDGAISNHMIFQLYRNSIHASSFPEHDVYGLCPGKTARISIFYDDGLRPNGADDTACGLFLGRRGRLLFLLKLANLDSRGR
jgi:hypothetical protein